MKILILNGPNLNLLGTREPSIYGNINFSDFLIDLKTKFSKAQIEHFQSNKEGDLIDKLHEVGFFYDGIVFNAGAYSHTSIALADAIKAITTPVVEVHISNTAKRESFRHHSYLSSVCRGTITGFGLNSYTLAVQSFYE